MDPILALIADLYGQVRQLAAELGQAKADIIDREKRISELQASIIDNTGAVS